MSKLNNFDDLETSTCTTMIYTNLTFDLDVLFKGLKITNVETPILTKKKKNINMKSISAPYGSIISVQSKTQLRGLDTQKKTKEWCTICRPTVKSANGDDKQVLTATECLKPIEGTDINDIVFYCSKCDKHYLCTELKVIRHFLNQRTIVISMGENLFLNIMVFRDNIKVAGCKNENDAKNMIQLLWRDYLVNIPGVATLKPGFDTVQFTFETVMKNLGFNLGFGISRVALNILMNDPKYSDKVHMSEYESTGHTNVNIKMFSNKPSDFKYEIVSYDSFTDTMPKISYTENVLFKKKKTAPTKYVTFIVFSSSEVILSGRYTENMKEMYDFFIKTVFDHRDQLEEKLVTPSEKDINSLKFNN